MEKQGELKMGDMEETLAPVFVQDTRTLHRDEPSISNDEDEANTWGPAISPAVFDRTQKLKVVK